MPLDFKKSFQDHIEQSKRAWGHDRTLTIGASEQFQCLRKTFFTKHKYAEDPDFTQSWGATTRGSLLEAHYVVPALLAAVPPGAELLWAGEDQVTLIDGYLSATPDGLLKNVRAEILANYGIPDIESDCILIEIKSFDSRLDIKEPKNIHVGQVQQQLGLTHAKTNHRPEYAVILYVNASWVDDVRPFIVKRNPEVYEAAKKRAELIYTTSDPARIPPEGKLNGTDCAYCPFASQCSITQVGTVPTTKRDSRFSEAEEDELRTIIQREKSLAKQIDALESQKKAAGEQVREFLRSHDTKWARTEDGYSVSWSTSAGRKKVDIDKIVEDTGIDLEQYTTFGDPSERLTIKAPKEA